MTGDLIGKKINRLTILDEKTSKGKRRVTKCLCLCECGNKKWIRKAKIKNGESKSCGCLRSEILAKKQKTHCMTNTKPYRAWQGMKSRCKNKNEPVFKHYGGRGITYDQKWEKFINFWKNMKDGYKDGLTLDRINTNGNYCKENCRWATWKEQQNNRRNTNKKYQKRKQVNK